MRILPARSPTARELVARRSLALSLGSPLRKVSGTFPLLPAAGKGAQKRKTAKRQSETCTPSTATTMASSSAPAITASCSVPTRLLSQPAFHQSLPHQRDAVVQGPRSLRTCDLHHAALRIRPSAQ